LRTDDTCGFFLSILGHCPFTDPLGYLGLGTAKHTATGKKIHELPGKPVRYKLQGGSNMTGTDLYVNKPHCAAAVRP